VREGRAGADAARGRLKAAGDVPDDRGRQHPDRDAQFRTSRGRSRMFAAAGDPVVSGTRRRRSSRPISPAPAGHEARGGTREGPRPRLPDASWGRSPIGIYDIAANTGFASVGTSHAPPAFAVNALRLWWRPRAPPLPGGAASAGHLRRRRPTATRSGSGRRAGQAAQRPAWRSTLAHFPPGTSSGTRPGTGCSAHITRNLGAPRP